MMGADVLDESKTPNLKEGGPVSEDTAELS
jgi:hypothetical protein